MPTKLKDLKITSTDLVTAGANPDSFVRLFKRRDTPDGDAPDMNLIQKIAAAIARVFEKNNLPDTVAKEATTFDEEMESGHQRELSNEAWGLNYALSDSLTSIICDGELSEDEKRSLMFQSLDEFAETLRGAIPNWAAGNCAEKDGAVMKSKAQEAAFEAYWSHSYAKAQGGDTPPAEPESEPIGDSNVAKSHQSNLKEEMENMKFDKSKMTPEELATLAEFEKKYGAAEPETPPATAPADSGVAKGAEPPATDAGNGTAPELHPEVKKALDDNKSLAARVEELTKRLEIKDLTAVAKKYEVIGKKADELAPKLYELKKAGGTAYDDYVTLLDEQVTLVEKSGLFGEYGKNTSGGMGAGTELDIKAAEIRKANVGMGQAEAFAKAYEEHPELAARYENTYNYKGRD